MNHVRAWVLMLCLACSAATGPAVNAALEHNDVRAPAVGVASWYGYRHQGRRMANGHRFHSLALTAASRRLPLGTRVRVTNLANGRSVVLTITDRGPYVGGRILDLSLGAARALRMVDRGLARVSIERT